MVGTFYLDNYFNDEKLQNRYVYVVNEYRRFLETNTFDYSKDAKKYQPVWPKTQTKKEKVNEVLKTAVAFLIKNNYK